MSNKYIISLDQGTTSCRALLIDEKGDIVAFKQEEFTQIFPKPGWVEHDPNEIWDVQYKVLKKLLSEEAIAIEQVSGIGITNQRETTVVWDKKSGKPIYNALVWQDKRTASFCAELKQNGWSDEVRRKTGLVIDSYFCASKIHWLLNNITGAKEKAANGDLLFGTIDTWLIWKLTNEKTHVTDLTNASRTMLFDIQKLQWDDELLSIFEIPKTMLPEVLPSAADFGKFEYEGHLIPIAGVAGDQQSALFGQLCFEPGTMKNTYGTGCFLLMNQGAEFKLSKNGLLTTLTCVDSFTPQYALEGSVFVAGAAIQWLRDGIKLINEAQETEKLAQESLHDDVYLVPAFVGLGAPYWDSEARGAIFGITRDTTEKEIAKAALQAMAYQTKDVIMAMEEDTGLTIQELKVDGGAVNNEYLMQFQSDILQVQLKKPNSIETTALGAAYLAGIQIGIWTLDSLKDMKKVKRTFDPEMPNEQTDQLYTGWKEAVSRTRGWLNYKNN